MYLIPKCVFEPNPGLERQQSTGRLSEEYCTLVLVWFSPQRLSLHIYRLITFNILSRKILENISIRNALSFCVGGNSCILYSQMVSLVREANMEPSTLCSPVSVFISGWLPGVLVQCKVPSITIVHGIGWSFSLGLLMLLYSCSCYFIITLY